MLEKIDYNGSRKGRKALPFVFVFLVGPFLTFLLEI